ncbi:MAG: transporter substrate-binding domain-containing protein [Cyanobacteria bacterium J06573_11]
MRRSQFLRSVIQSFGGMGMAVTLPALTAACQRQADESNSSTENGSAENKSAENASAEEVAEVALLDAMPERGQVWRVAIAPDIRPFSMIEKDRLVGFDLDLIQAIARTCEAAVEITKQPFSALIPALQANQIDIAMGGITPTEDSLSRVAFSEPYFRSGVVIVTHADNPQLNAIDQLEDTDLAVTLDTAGARIAIDISGSRLLTYSQTLDTLKAVESKEADAALVALPILLAAMKSGEVSNLQYSPDLINPRDFSIAIRTNASNTNASNTNASNKELESSPSAERLQTINSAIETLKAEGTYDDIRSSWLGEKND